MKAISIEVIPSELRAIPRWVCWRWEMRKKKDGTSERTKPPYQIDGKKASTTNPATWTTFDRVIRVVNRFDGIGLVLDGSDDLIGVDLDHAFSKEGCIEPWADEAVRLLNSYSEISPSGKGIRIFLHGTLSKNARNRKGNVEIYATKRFLTVTGNVVPGTPSGVELRQKELETFLQRFGLIEEKNTHVSMPTVKLPNITDDDKLLEKMFKAKNGPSIRSLFDGDSTGHDSESEARMSLLCHFAWWTDCNAAQMDRLYRRSGRDMSKWDRLGQKEIEKAVALTKRGHSQAPLSVDKKKAIQPSEPTRGYLLFTNKKGEIKKLKTALAGKQFLKVGHSMLSAYESLYIYRDGCYRPEGDKAVQKWVLDGYDGLWKKADSVEVESWLRIECRVQEEVIDQGELINLQNGLLDWSTGKIIPHSPKKLSVIQLPTIWDPKAYYQRGDQFLNEVLPDQETRLVLEEAIGYCLMRDCRFEKAFMLTGEGSNGKSVFLNWLCSTLGRGNISAVKLQDLDERFRTAELVGKLANIYSDLPREALKDSGIFKILVSGERLTAEHKFRDPFNFRNRAKLFFSANELPRTEDRTNAFFRRWLIFPFPFRFEHGSTSCDPNLSAKLITDEGRSYLLRLAVDGLQRLVARGHFQSTAVTHKALEEYRLDTDSVAAFFDARCKYIEGNRETKANLYSAYKTWAESNGLKPCSEPVFAKRLKAIEPRLVDSRSRSDGERVRRWENLSLIPEVYGR